jgi:hypothetical protein
VAKDACLAKIDSLSKIPVKTPTLEDHPFETDSESESGPEEVNSNEISDWADIIPTANSPKVDEEALFRRVDSKRDLTSAKSLLTAMLSGSVPVAPVEIRGSRRQVGKVRYRSPDQKALSPRSTRRNMLSTELSVSLRQHLLWERQQKWSGVLPFQSKYELRGDEVTNVTVKKERSNSF